MLFYIFNVEMGDGTQVRVVRRKATILADYKFFSTVKVDDCFQFIDCTEVNGFSLARDICAGIVQVQHSRVVIALGNAANLDQFSNVASVVVAIINAIIDRHGCVNKQIWVAGLIPRPTGSLDTVQMMKQQNKSLFKSVRALVCRKNYPVVFLPVYKWLLKRVKHPDGSFTTEADLIYFEQNSDELNAHRLAHLHLLVAGELDLRRIKYKWKGMPIVNKQNQSRQVMDRITGLQSSGTGNGHGAIKHLRKGHGNRLKSQGSTHI